MLVDDIGLPAVVQVQAHHPVPLEFGEGFAGIQSAGAVADPDRVFVVRLEHRDPGFVQGRDLVVVQVEGSFQASAPGWRERQVSTEGDSSKGKGFGWSREQANCTVSISLILVERRHRRPNGRPGRRARQG